MYLIIFRRLLTNQEINSCASAIIVLGSNSIVYCFNILCLYIEYCTNKEYQIQFLNRVILKMELNKVVAYHLIILAFI